MRKYAALLLFSVCLSISLTRAQSNFIGSGISLQFNGSTGNYVDLDNVFNSLAFPFSFEAWINPNPYPSIWGGIMGSDNDVSAYYGYWIRISSSGTLEIEFGDSYGSGYQFRRGYVTTTSIPLSKWTHIAVVC